MVDHPKNVIRAVAQPAAEHIGRFDDRGPEQNTKPHMIEPLLKALGWNLPDPDTVRRGSFAGASLAEPT
jgi:predicted type IV restriction endonuclease